MDNDGNTVGGLHRVGVLAEVPAAILQCGGNPGAVLAAANIEPGLLRNPENSIPFPAAGRLLAEAASATRCPHFGLIVGAKGGLASLGLVGRLMGSAPTLHDAILDLCMNQIRYIRGAIAYLRAHDGVASWGYLLQRPQMTGFVQIVDAAVMIGRRMLHELAGVDPEHVLLNHAVPKDPGPYKAAFGVIPQFNAVESCVLISQEILAAPVRTANPSLHLLLRRQIDAHWALTQPTAGERASRVLYAALMADGASLEAVADMLGLSARTLNRKLQAEGITFRQLLDDVRYDLACQLLGATPIPVTEVAIALNYERPAAFARAFRRMCGQTPSEWRRSNGGTGC
jgi:AraC-like DNA-binding protein